IGGSAGAAARRHGGARGKPARRSPSAVAVASAELTSLADAEQVDDEDQRLAGQLVPRTGRPVGLLRRDDQLPAAADLHPRDAVLPPLDQALQRERDGL